MKQLSFPTWLRSHSLRLALGALGLFVCLLSMSGCAGASAPTDNMAMLPEDQRTSTVPFNKPESWEGRGQLGALGNNNPRFLGSQ